MALYLVGYLLPIVMAALALPLILGKVPPNQLYGFRTPKTLSSPAIWYPANRIAGWWMIAGASAAICFNLALLQMKPEWPPEKLITWMAGSGAAAVILASVASLVSLRKL
jgi:uncharacterized membrane protein